VGWQDRDYTSETYAESGTSRWRPRRPPTATLTLMILHGAAFVLVLSLSVGSEQPAVTLLPLEGPQSHPLGIALHPFATQNILSILFVVLAFWSLGGRLEPRLGSARFVTLYVLGNLAAGGAYFGVARLLPALGGAPLDYPVGALAGLCVAAWQHLRQEVVMVFGRITNAGKVFLICGAIVVGLEVITGRQGAVPWLAAAAAGSATALLLHQVPHLATTGHRRIRRTVRPSIPRTTARPPPIDEVEIDDILAKISRTGLHSLTPAERERLDAARRAKVREEG